MPARDRSADQDDMAGGDTVEVDSNDDGGDDAVAEVAVMVMIAAAISAIRINADEDDVDAGMMV